MRTSAISAPIRPARPGDRRWGIIAVGLGLTFLVALVVSGLAFIPRFQAAHPVSPLQRSDANRVSVDDLYLDLTLVTPEFATTRKLDRYLGGHSPESVLPVLVGVNTHTGTIHHMHHLGGKFELVGPDQARYPSLDQPIVLTTHHNAYMLLFPSRDNHGHRFLDGGPTTLAVEATGLGKTRVRRFQWDLPIEAGAGGFVGATGVARTVVLAVALLGALLVVLSPCALELTLYYLSIITATVAEGETEAADGQSVTDVDGVGRRRILINLASFVAGFTLLYALSGATVGLVGQGIRSPLGEYGELIQILGGGLILFFALRVLGVGRLLAGRGKAELPACISSQRDTWSNRALARPRFWLARMRLRAREKASRKGGTMRARDSFLVGIGLSSSCLTCMGGAVLYPLMVYAGITSWYSGFITLGLYSLGISVPMVFIALGFFRIRLSLTKRLGVNRALRTASGLMMASIGLLILSGHERAVTDVAFWLMAGVSRWLA